MRVLANPAALKIVLANLMGNAAKFTRDAEPARVRVGQRADGEALCASACRTTAPASTRHAPTACSGLSAGCMRVTSYAGSGIGLSIVQRIIERHGGTVRASSDGAGLGRASSSRWHMPRWSPPAAAIDGAVPAPSGRPDSVVAMPG